MQPEMPGAQRLDDAELLLAVVPLRFEPVRALEPFGRVVQRAREGAPVFTDAGNYVYDLFAGTIADPAELDQRLHSIPGVVETGLFVGRADVVIVAGRSGVRRLERRA